MVKSGPDVLLNRSGSQNNIQARKRYMGRTDWEQDDKITEIGLEKIKQVQINSANHIEVYHKLYGTMISAAAIATGKNYGEIVDNANEIADQLAKEAINEEHTEEVEVPYEDLKSMYKKEMNEKTETKIIQQQRTKGRENFSNFYKRE
ncbi:hypothetical protein PV325_009486 [Microctonus aethiopoides]|nr:hypothetical protein PV325_009486 [Microctonus aethiopoides]